MSGFESPPPQSEQLRWAALRITELEQEVERLRERLAEWEEDWRTTLDLGKRAASAGERLSDQRDALRTDQARLRRIEKAARLVQEAFRPYREDMVRHALEALDAALGEQP